MQSSDILDTLAYTYNYEEYQNNNDFWYIIDHMNLQHITIWCTRLSKTTLLSDHSSKDWLTLLDLINLSKNNSIELTPKQKRFMVMCLLPYYNELSQYYVL